MPTSFVYPYERVVVLRGLVPKRLLLSTWVASPCQQVGICGVANGISLSVLRSIRRVDL